MAIETIIELPAMPGMREELARITDRIVATMRDVPGFLAITRHAVLEDPDRLVEVPSGTPCGRGKRGSIGSQCLATSALWWRSLGHPSEPPTPGR